MKFVKIVALCVLMIASTPQGGQCRSHTKEQRKKCFASKRLNPQIGIAAFTANTSAEWYQITTQPYPTVVPLSLNRDRGSTQGNVKLTPTGLLIRQPGNYSVTFNAILVNNEPNYAPLIPVFLIRNDIFDPNATDILGNVVTLPPNFINTVQFTGILENVKPCTKLSLVATNGGSPEPQPITVISWSISAYRIP